jgi:hypothetical protein
MTTEVRRNTRAPLAQSVDMSLLLNGTVNPLADVHLDHVPLLESANATTAEETANTEAAVDTAMTTTILGETRRAGTATVTTGAAETRENMMTENVATMIPGGIRIDDVITLRTAVIRGTIVEIHGLYYLDQ